MKNIHPEVSKYMSGLSKKRKKRPKKIYQEMQKKSVIARLKKKSTSSIAK